MDRFLPKTLARNAPWTATVVGAPGRGGCLSIIVLETQIVRMRLACLYCDNSSLVVVRVMQDESVLSPGELEEMKHPRIYKVGNYFSHFWGQAPTACSTGQSPLWFTRFFFSLPATIEHGTRPLSLRLFLIPFPSEDLLTNPVAAKMRVRGDRPGLAAS